MQFTQLEKNLLENVNKIGLGMKNVSVQVPMPGFIPAYPIISV
jgi:hypothetical protein